ncbi:transporter [Agitococcus lubricus]|uniref:Zinc transporter n=1 Tax=Agitococcus lubricus TaxID=1077255 RepID=A0A2T5J1X1_9GAMM|nr:transporter [Agitococcus lubricus]PTQ90434.1 zinc transporter [Agitococcus lubricus]
MRQPINTLYGSDETGLICGYVFSPEGIHPLSSNAASLWLQNTDNQTNSFIWLHFNLSHSACEKWLHQYLNLSPIFYEALHEGTRSSRIEYVDDSLIAVINDVVFDFSVDATDVATLYLSVSQHVVVSARVKPLVSIDRLRAAVKQGEQLSSTVDLLVHLLRDQADVMTQIARDVARHVDHIEDTLLSNRLDIHRANLGNLRRLLLRLQRLLAPEPSALFRLLSRPPRWMIEDDTVNLRQSTEEFSTVLRDMSALQERIKLLQEEIAAHINEQNNRSLFVLSTVTVLALPINLTASLLGMNVGGIPLANNHAGFWLIILLVATLTCIAVWFAFGHKND